VLVLALLGPVATQFALRMGDEARDAQAVR
jgi:hypothetical protein